MHLIMIPFAGELVPMPFICDSLRAALRAVVPQGHFLALLGRSLHGTCGRTRHGFAVPPSPEGEGLGALPHQWYKR